MKLVVSLFLADTEFVLSGETRGPTPVATERSGGGGGDTVGGIRKQGRSGEGSVGLSDRERANIFSASGAQPVITASIVCKWKLKKMHLTLWKGKHSSPRGERAGCVFRAGDISPGIVPPAPNRIEQSAKVYRPCSSNYSRIHRF